MGLFCRLASANPSSSFGYQAIPDWPISKSDSPRSVGLGAPLLLLQLKKKENGHIVAISQMQLDPKMRRKGRFYQKVSLSSLPGG